MYLKSQFLYVFISIFIWLCKHYFFRSKFSSLSSILYLVTNRKDKLQKFVLHWMALINHQIRYSSVHHRNWSLHYIPYALKLDQIKSVVWLTAEKILILSRIRSDIEERITLEVLILKFKDDMIVGWEGWLKVELWCIWNFILIGFRGKDVNIEMKMLWNRDFWWLYVKGM